MFGDEIPSCLATESLDVTMFAGKIRDLVGLIPVLSAK
jgi:hypothetical protein